MASFDRLDLVVIPFPFTEMAVEKRGPALSLSPSAWVDAHGHESSP
jgi:hypothetical protein